MISFLIFLLFQSLEVSMPLLAAKLAPSTMPGPTGTSQRGPTFSKVSAANSSELTQSPQQSQLGLSQHSPQSQLGLSQSPQHSQLGVSQSPQQSQLGLLVMSQMSTTASPPLVTSGVTSKSSAKSPHYMNASDASHMEETKRQLQQTRLPPSSSPRTQMMYNQDSVLLSDVKSAGISVSSTADQMWALGQGQADNSQQQVSTLNLDLQMKSASAARNKHQTLTSTATEILNLGQTDRSSKPVLQSRVEYGSGQPKLNWNTSLTVRAHLDQHKTPPDKRAKTDLEDPRSLSLSSPHGLMALQRHMAGDSKQTAIDVDLTVSVGQLASIVSEETPALVAKNSSGAATSLHKIHSNISSVNLKDSNFNQSHQTPHAVQAAFLGKTTKSSSHTYSSSNPSMPITMSIADICVSKPGEVKQPTTLPSQHTVSGSSLSSKYSAQSSNLSANALRSANSTPAMISAAQVSSSASHRPTFTHTHGGVPTSKQPPAYESLPPPYPHPSPVYSLDNSRLSNTVKKESNHNPFTFPTSGLAHTSDTSGLSIQTSQDFSAKPLCKPPPAWSASPSLTRAQAEGVSSHKHLNLSSSELAARLTDKSEYPVITNHVAQDEVVSHEPTVVSFYQPPFFFLLLCLIYFLSFIVFFSLFNTLV